MANATQFTSDLVDDLTLLKSTPTQAPTAWDLQSAINAIQELQFLHNAKAQTTLKTTK